MSKRIIKVGLCTIRDGKLLLARSRGDTLFQIPGGKIEPGETDIQALIREVWEELHAKLIDPIYLNTFVAPAAGRPGMLVEVRLYQGSLSRAPKASSEIEELRWQGITEPAKNCTSTVADHILPYLQHRV